MSYIRNYYKLVLCTMLLVRICFGQATCFSLDGTDANHPNGLFVQLAPAKSINSKPNTTSTYISQIANGAQLLWDATQGPTSVSTTTIGATLKAELSACVPPPVNPTTAPPQSVPFSNTALSNGAHAMVAVDFNRDGFADAAALIPGGNQLMVYVANSDGTFQAPIKTTLGNATTKLSSIGVADFNNDKKADLAIVDAGNNVVYVLFGKGDGTFFSKSDPGLPQVTIPVGHSPGGLTIADFNGDNIPDIAVANSADNTISVTRSLGDGTFIPASVFTVGKTPVALLAQDLNGDGKVDLVVADHGSSDLAVLFGLGTGGFQSAVFTKTPAPATYLSSADFNNDGAADIAALAEDVNAVMMFTGSFQGKLTFAGAFLVPNLSASFSVNDFDGDGNLDLLVPDTDSGSAVLLLGRGDGTMNAPPVYAGTSGLTSIAAGDFNNDGKLDLVVTGANSTTSTLSFLSGRGNGQFQNPVNIPVSGRTDVVGVGDFNKDGRLDIAVSGSQLNILLGQSNGTFVQGAQLPNIPPSVIADFNKDGKLDIAGPFNGGVGVLLGNGDGTFRSTVAVAAGSNPLTVVSADFNHDGTPDLAVLNGGTAGSTTDPGGVTVLLGNGTGSFPNATNVPAGINPRAVAAGDVNGDGKADLVVASTASGSSFIYVFLGKGDGTFSTPFSEPLPAGETTNSVAILDVDNDGSPDIVVGDCCADASTLYLRGNGDGTFQPATPFYGGNDVRAIVIGDWNGDGRPDLAFAYSPASNPSLSGVVPLINHVDPRKEGGPVMTSGASFLPGPISPDSIVAIFGTNLTNGTASSSDTSSFPTTLANTSVTIKDSKGVSRMAQLFFVSPTQINYLVPADTALGTASISISSPSGVSVTSAIVISAAPGIFTVNSSGLAAGAGVLVQGNNQSAFNISTTDPTTGAVIASPINIGTRLNRAYLVLYGTGIRNRTDLDSVNISVGGMYTPAIYAGPQSQYPGLDQLNFQIPPALAGKGMVTINVSVNGASANPVNVVIQ